MAQDFDILSGSVDKFSEESLTNLYASQIKCTTGFTGVNSVIKTFNANSDKSTTIAKAVGQSNQKLGAYLTKVAEQGNGASASISGYGLSLVKMSARAVLAKTAQMALNTAITAGISFLVSEGFNLLFKFFDSLIVTAEEAAQAAQEIKDSYKETTETISDNLKSLQDVESEFNKLSKGVGKNGENVSLTSEEYKRYHEICNQIVGINPSMLKTYDEQGNAILKNNDAIKETIELLREQQKQKAKEFVSDDNIDTIIKDSKNKTDEILETIDSINNEKASLKGNIDNSLRGFINEFNTYASGINSNSTSDFTNEIKQFDFVKYIDMSDEEFRNNSDKFADDIKKFYDLVSKYNIEFGSDLTGWINQLDNSYNSNIANFDQQIAEEQQNLEKYNSDIINILKEVPKSTDEYYDLSASQKSFVDDFIDSFKMDFSLSEDDQHKLVDDFIEDIEGLISQIQTDAHLRIGINYVYDLNDNMTAEEYQKQIEKILSALKRSKYFEGKNDNEILLEIGLGIKSEGSNEVQTEVEQQINNIKERAKKVWGKEISLDNVNVKYIKELADLDFNNFDSFAEAMQDIKSVVEDSANFETLKENFETLKDEKYTEVSQGIEKFNSALKKLSDDEALSGDEMLELVELNGDLAGAFTQTADGFIIDSDKLLAARKDYTEITLKYIEAEIEANRLLAESQEENLQSQKERLTKLKDKRADLISALESAGRNHLDTDEIVKKIITVNQQIDSTKGKIETCNESIGETNNQMKIEQSIHDAINGKLDEANALLNKKNGSAETADEYYEDQVYQIDKAIRKIQLEIDKQEKVLETLEKQKEELEEIISNYETAASTAQSFIDMQKESVEKEKELVSDSFDKRIEQLENQKKALESQNDNISKQINLQEKLNNLNKAKSQMVATYREDGGWTIGQNASAVNKAQNEYDEAVRQNNIDNIQGQIDTLTTEKDNKLSQYDKDIEKWDEYKQKWSDAVGSYKLKQNELIASQMLGSNWKASILARDTGIINNFESNYNGYQTRLHDDVEKEIEAVNNSIQSKQNEISSWELTKTHLNEWVEAIKKGDNQRLSDLSYFISEEQRLKNGHLEFLENFNSEYKRLSDLSEINGQEPTYYAVKDSNGNTVDKFTNRTDAELLKNQLHQANLTKAIRGKQYTTEELQSIVESMKNDYTVQSYSTGGVIDYTGMANVHGSSSSPEVIFNSADAKKLFNVIHNSDNFLSSFTQSLSDRLYRDTIDQFHNVVNQNNNSTHYSPTFIRFPARYKQHNSNS